MGLTLKELNELSHLNSLRSSRLIPMMPEQQKRQEQLTKKLYHNDCLNPQCRGFTGLDKDTHCPFCNSELFKAK